MRSLVIPDSDNITNLYKSCSEFNFDTFEYTIIMILLIQKVILREVNFVAVVNITMKANLG